MKKHFMVLSLLLAFLTCISGNTYGEEVIDIGTLFPMSGPMALGGIRDLNGVELATLMVNEKGGVLGKKINLVKADASSPEAAQSEAERLITLKKIKLIIGSYSSQIAFVASAVAEKNGVIYWEMVAVADNLTQRGFKYFFRTGCSASLLGVTAANFAGEAVASKLGKSPKELKVGVIHEDSLFGSTVGPAGAKRLKELGFNVVAVESYNAKTTDLSPLVMKLKALNPDIIITTSYINDGILLCRQMKELNLNTKVLIGTGGGFETPDFGKGLGKDVNGFFSLQPLFFTNPAALDPKLDPPLKDVLKRFKEKYGYEMDSPGMSGFGAAMVLYKFVLPKAGSFDPEAVRKAALQVDVPEGSTVLGFGIKFAGDGDPNQGQNIKAYTGAMQWQNEKSYVVYPKKNAEKDIIDIPLKPWNKR